MRQHVLKRVAWIAILGATLTGGPIGQALATETVAGRLSHLAMMRRVARDAVSEMLASVTLEPGVRVAVAPSRPHAGNDIVAHALAELLTDSGHDVRVLRALPGSDGGDAAGDEDGDEDGDDDGDGDARDDAGTGNDDSGESSAAGSDADDEPASMLEHLMAQDGSIAAPAGDRTDPAAGARGAIGATAAGGPLLVFDVSRFDLRYVGQRRPYLFGRKQVERVVAVDVTCELRPGAGDIVRETGHGDAISIDWISHGKLAAYEGGAIAPQELSTGSGLRFVEPVIVGGIVAGLVYLFYTN